jgi:hypothetical protein
MREKALKMFQREVERQCSFALTAYSALRRAERENDMYLVWYSVQALLVALGNVSKLLWPARSGDRVRGIRLRMSLEVDANSLLQDRSFRNHFEHFDERLDEWASISDTLDYADSNIGTTPGVGVPFWFAEGEYLRNIYRTDYPPAFAIAFRGEDFDLPSVIEAVRELKDKAAEASRDLPGRGRM